MIFLIEYSYSQIHTDKKNGGGRGWGAGGNEWVEFQIHNRKSLGMGGGDDRTIVTLQNATQQCISKWLKGRFYLMWYFLAMKQTNKKIQKRKVGAMVPDLSLSCLTFDQSFLFSIKIIV